MKPFTLAFTSTGDMKEKIAVVKGALQAKASRWWRVRTV